MLLIATPAWGGDRSAYGICETPYGTYGRSVMAHIVINAPVRCVFETLKDVGRFAEFFPFVERSRILEQHDNIIRAEFHSRYLRMIELTSISERSWDEPHHFSSVTPSGLLKGSFSSWTLMPTADGTEVRYRNSVNPNVPVPGYVASYLVNHGLPEMLESLRRRVESGGTWHK